MVGRRSSFLLETALTPVWGFAFNAIQVGRASEESLLPEGLTGRYEGTRGLDRMRMVRYVTCGHRAGFTYRLRLEPCVFKRTGSDKKSRALMREIRGSSPSFPGGFDRSRSWASRRSGGHETALKKEGKENFLTPPRD